MRSKKRFLALLFSGLMLFSGVAMAAPPEDDPTCGNPGGPASGQECAGDNGDPGCQGINIAREHAEDTPAADAIDLVTDILDDGPVAEECDTDDRGRP
ncbi:MAG: hypothetical protein KY450_11835 [Actinobacteria bacterium]|nr:hypothetical protein [Actinomycetota bacterium]